MNPPEDLIDDLRLLDPPEPFRLNPWIVAAGLIAIVLIWWLARRRRATQAPRRRESTMRKAQEDALAELKKLFALIEREESRPYAQESSGIIRRYIEVRFELNAPRQSTEEFLEEVQHSPRLTPTHRGLLGEYLRVCDLLKFAKTLANRDELKALHEAAVNFVKETRYVPQAEPA
jgi:hypothetical protein